MRRRPNTCQVIPGVPSAAWQKKAIWRDVLQAVAVAQAEPQLNAPPLLAVDLLPQPSEGNRKGCPYPDVYAERIRPLGGHGALAYEPPTFKRMLNKMQTSPATIIFRPEMTRLSLDTFPRKAPRAKRTTRAMPKET